MSCSQAGTMPVCTCPQMSAAPIWSQMMTSVPMWGPSTSRATCSSGVALGVGGFQQHQHACNAGLLWQETSAPRVVRTITQPVATVTQVMPQLQRVITGYGGGQLQRVTTGCVGGGQLQRVTTGCVGGHARMSVTSMQSVQMAAGGFGLGGFAAIPAVPPPMPPPPVVPPVMVAQASVTATGSDEATALAAMSAAVNAAEQQVMEKKFQKWPLMRQNSLLEEQEEQEAFAATSSSTSAGWQQQQSSGGAGAGWSGYVGVGAGEGFTAATSVGSAASMSGRLSSRMPVLGEVIAGPVKEHRIRASAAFGPSASGPAALGLEGEGFGESNDAMGEEYSYRKQTFKNPMVDYKYQTYSVPRKVTQLERGRSNTGF